MENVGEGQDRVTMYVHTTRKQKDDRQTRGIHPNILSERINLSRRHEDTVLSYADKGQQHVTFTVAILLCNSTLQMVPQ